MDTRERLLKYRSLLETNPDAAATFLEENGHDERFASLVQLGTTFLDGFRARLEEQTQLAPERLALRKSFEAEFLQGWAQVMDFAASTARESARRLIA